MLDLRFEGDAPLLSESGNLLEHAGFGKSVDHLRQVGPAGGGEEPGHRLGGELQVPVKGAEVALVLDDDLELDGVGFPFVLALHVRKFRHE